MSNKIKDITKKNHTYFFNDIIITKNLGPNNIKIDEKYSYLLHWLCDDQRFKVHKD